MKLKCKCCEMEWHDKYFDRNASHETGLNVWKCSWCQSHYHIVSYLDARRPSHSQFAYLMRRIAKTAKPKARDLARVLAFGRWAKNQYHGGNS